MFSEKCGTYGSTHLKCSVLELPLSLARGPHSMWGWFFSGAGDGSQAGCDVPNISVQVYRVKPQKSVKSIMGIHGGFRFWASIIRDIELWWYRRSLKKYRQGKK